MFPTHTHPFQFPLCFYLFHPLTSFSSEKAHLIPFRKPLYKELQLHVIWKTVIPRVWNISYEWSAHAPPILPPRNDAKCKKESNPGNEGISNIKTTSNAAGPFQGASAALPYCTRSQPEVILKVADPNIFSNTWNSTRSCLTHEGYQQES